VFSTRGVETMDSDVLHIVFTLGGASSLREALRTEGRKERVVCLLDDLSFGPIDPPDPDVRKAWVETELGFTGWPDTPEGSFPWATTETGDVSWDGLGATTRKFWSEALSDRARKVVWMTRRSAKEYTGFLAWLWQLGDAPCEIVDLTECSVSDYRHYRPDQGLIPQLRVVSLDRMWPESIVGNRLLDRAAPLQASDRSRYRELWRQLRTENAPFRVVGREGLISAPISAFDETLMSRAVGNWRKVALIVGQVVSAQDDVDLCQCDNMVLAARIDALVERGALEFQGRTAFAMRFSEVRLPPRKADSRVH
jgi:Protein of unknown function/Domain of unknown function (DUF1835)